MASSWVLFSQLMASWAANIGLQTWFSTFLHCYIVFLDFAFSKCRFPAGSSWNHCWCSWAALQGSIFTVFGTRSLSIIPAFALLASWSYRCTSWPHWQALYSTQVPFLDTLREFWTVRTFIHTDSCTMSLFWLEAPSITPAVAIITIATPLFERLCHNSCGHWAHYIFTTTFKFNVVVNFLIESTTEFIFVTRFPAKTRHTCLLSCIA